MTEIIPDPDIKEFDGVYVGGKKRLPPNEYNLSRLAEYLRKTNKKFSDLSKEEKKALEEMESSDNFKPNTSIKEKIFKKFKSLFD